MARESWRPGLTIVTPSYEKHFVQFCHMIESLALHCQDIDQVNLVVIVERANQQMFADACARVDGLTYRVLLTEEVFADFGVTEKPTAFLKRIGKFTFQTLKKFGGLLGAETQWSLVLDSETLFHKPFSAGQLLQDYIARKYVFYTRTAPRGAKWRDSTGFAVTRNAGEALSVSAGDRWYMEYFHWFYETEKLRDMVANRLGPAFYRPITTASAPPIDFFENILYYVYLQHFHADEYDFLDFQEVLEQYLPERLAARFKLDELPFSLFGNEYLLNILAPEDIADIAPLFTAYKLPFVRLEPPFFSTRYLPELMKLPSFVATISSHHLTWLRKKIAVCISGEFRHEIHRVPEHHVRHLLGFLAGVDCDIYLHGWSNPSEALILHELKPRVFKFEPRPSFAALSNRIATTEPRIKPGRDEGSLAMFHGIEEAYKLMEPYADEYDYVLRIRPDLYIDHSLKEIMVQISDQGDFLPDTIYVPRHFHSKGINDQVALGPTSRMAVYAKTFSYIRENIEALFFNPESILLRNLLENQVQIAAVDMPYALMRNEPIRINTIHEHFHRQFHVWWSRTDDLPPFEDLSAYFSDKLKTMDAAMRELLPDPVYLRLPASDGGDAVLSAHIVDNDPAMTASALFNRFGCWVTAPFVIEDGCVRQVTTPVQRQLFVFPSGDDSLTVAEWRHKDGRFISNRITVSNHSQAMAPLVGTDVAVDHAEPMLRAFQLAAPATEPKRMTDNARGTRRFSARDLFTQDGQLSDDAIVGTFRNGRLFYGPYTELPAGRYLATVDIGLIEGAGTIGLKVTTSFGQAVIAKTDIVVATGQDNIVAIPFDLDSAVSNLEVICDIQALHRISVKGLVISERADLPPRPRPARKPSLLAKVMGYANL